MYAGNGFSCRQRFEVVGILLMVVGEMSVAALNSETAGQPVESVYNVDDGVINHIIAETGQHFLLLLRIGGVFHQLPWLGEGFYGGCSCS